VKFLLSSLLIFTILGACTLDIRLFALFTAKEQLLSLMAQTNALPSWKINSALGILNHVIINMPALRALQAGHTLLF
jgi:hypothetical protein